MKKLFESFMDNFTKNLGSLGMFFLGIVLFVLIPIAITIIGTK